MLGRFICRFAIYPNFAKNQKIVKELLEWGRIDALTHLAAIPLNAKKKQPKNSYFRPIIEHFSHLKFASA
jgi:hypothetical protein